MGILTKKKKKEKKKRGVRGERGKERETGWVLCFTPGPRDKSRPPTSPPPPLRERFGRFWGSGGVRRAGVGGWVSSTILPLMVASILTDDEVVLHNVPSLLDVDVLIQLLDRLGKKATLENGTTLIISKNETEVEAPYELVKKMRASIIVLGPLLAKHGFCKVALPGGCAFGPRPIDLHLKGMEWLGAHINLESGYIEARANELIGTTMTLSGEFGPTVLGTDNVMMAATLAKGTTIIKDAACEPECSDLANMLNLMGAKITGIGTNTLKIEGVEKLNGVDYTVIPDRIEAGTYLAMAASTRSKITLTNVCIEHIECIIELLKNIGCSLEIDDKKKIITIDAKNKKLKPFKIETLPYPHFPTDLQAIFTALASTINGESIIRESVFPDRFTHIGELNRMGANVRLHEHDIIVNGKENTISSADVQASDLRAGAALVVAASAARGESNIHRIYHIERGYEKIEEKLKSIGVNISKKEDDIL